MRATCSLGKKDIRVENVPDAAIIETRTQRGFI